MTEHDPNIAPEAGHRARQTRSGEVRGSGSGAGGGNPSEDYDTDDRGGDGVLPTDVGTASRGTSSQDRPETDLDQ
jgi:hypothetical protein